MGEPPCTERMFEVSYCRLCRQKGSKSVKVFQCSCQQGMHWECLEREVKKKFLENKAREKNKGFNHLYLPCRQCGDKLLFLILCDQIILKIGNFWESFGTNKKFFFCTTFYIVLICTAYGVGSYFLGEIFKTTNGLLLVWVVLGLLVVAISVQQILLILLKQELKGVKVIQIFGQKNSTADDLE